MRILIPAAVSAVLALLYFAGVPAEFELWRNAALAAASVWLLIAGFTAARDVRSVRGMEKKLKQLEESQARLKSELAEAPAKLEQAQKAKAAAESFATQAERARETAVSELAQAKRALAESESARQAGAVETAQAVQRAKDEADQAVRRAEGALSQAKALAGKAGDDEVVNFLALLQQKGRFLDFIMDDVTKYPDAQIGAAARVVHQGCTSVVREYFDIKPVHDGQEGAPLTLTKDYDAHKYRLLGRVTGEPPFTGRVLHRGWLTTSVKLPERVDQQLPVAPTGIIAPAEVELS